MSESSASCAAARGTNTTSSNGTADARAARPPQDAGCEFRLQCDPCQLALMLADPNVLSVRLVIHFGGPTLLMQERKNGSGKHLDLSYEQLKATGLSGSPHPSLPTLTPDRPYSLNTARTSPSPASATPSSLKTCHHTSTLAQAVQRRRARCPSPACCGSHRRLRGFASPRKCCTRTWATDDGRQGEPARRRREKMPMRVVPTPAGYAASSRTLAVATGARHEVGSAARAWAGSRALFEGAGRGARRARRALDGEHSRARSQSVLYGAIDDIISRNFWFFFFCSQYDSRTSTFGRGSKPSFS